MKTIWIILFMTHSCVQTHVDVKAFSSNAECIKYGENLVKENGFWQNTQYQCSTPEGLLEATK